MQTVRDVRQFEARFPGGHTHLHSKEYKDYERERNRQNEAIAHLASETGWRAEDIGPLYRWIFRELKQDAQVHDYLFILTAKQVKRMLNKRDRMRHPD